MTVSIVGGLFVGCIYGVFAIGLVLVYQVSRTVNFAAASIAMIGAFVFTDLRVGNGWPVLPAAATGVAVAGALGGLGYVLIARPLQNKHPVASTLATFGLGALLYTFAARQWGLRPIESTEVLQGSAFRILGYTFMRDDLLSVLLGLIAVGGVTLLLRRTSLGVQVRATAMDAIAAGQSGIRTDLVAGLVWVAAAASAGLAAILVSSQVSMTVDFTSGLMLRALIAALIGGLTSVSGAFAGGLVLGVIEALIGYQVSGAGLPELVLALIVVALLAARPTGLRAAEY
ncbi:branched-chain amino acid ABC transporter permease [Streptomyces sp. NPDC008343]|uniref:branched-chain amino acid ABC transporter permease n=1 Tax=Streptomyces sp. NPDC008343 TaxID=3364828 RepID=UPI0036E2AFF5